MAVIRRIIIFVALLSIRPHFSERWPVSFWRVRHGDVSYVALRSHETQDFAHVLEPPRRSALADSWFGIRQVPRADIPFVARNLGGQVIVIGAPDDYTADQINFLLDQAQANGYQAVVIISSDTTCSRRPWQWDGEQWVFPQFTVDVLAGISDHPALFAIYALHEPFDNTNLCPWTVEQQKALYQSLKGYTNGVPVWSDLGGIATWEQRDIALSDGICDYCGTFRHRFRSDWTSQQCLGDILDWIDADLDAQQRLMPNSQIVFQVQVYAYADYIFPLRLPTFGELVVVRDHLCALSQPMVFYLWTHSTYDEELKNAPALWPAVEMGCPVGYVYLPLVLSD